MCRWRSQQRLAEEEGEEGGDLGNHEGDAPETRTLAANTIGRRGAAANVARIVPVAYSLLMTKMPRMPRRSMPPKYTPRGSHRLAGTWPSRRPTSSSSERAVTASGDAACQKPTKTVMPSVHIVERTVRSFVHSLRMRSTMRYRPAGAAARGTGVLSTIALTVIDLLLVSIPAGLRGTRRFPR